MDKKINQKYKYLFWVPIVLLVIAVFTAGYQFRRAEAMKISVENNYNRAFHEFVDYVDDIDSLLQKSVLISSSAQMSSISSELFRKTSAAKACLAQLPISEVLLENTEKFLSQIGDYTYTLSQKSIYNEEITEEDYKNLSSLGDYASSLKDELLKMQDDIYAGVISFGEVGKEANSHLSEVANAAADNIISDFEGVEKKFQEYPALIYDGPFSEHIERINPTVTENSKSCTEKEALEKAKAFVSEWGGELAIEGESQNTALESYLFKGSSEGGGIYAAFTKKGAYPLYFLIDREITEEKISVDEAIGRGREFLSSRGFSNMKSSYYDKANGVATINFAYEQGNVTCYSDLIKVKVALDNGEIIGFESNGYLMNHRQRSFETPSLSEEEAKAKINKHLNIDGISLAMIPKNNKTEVLCYEIKGNHKGKNFLIYINAQNGREEQILMLLESENGILTI